MVFFLFRQLFLSIVTITSVLGFAFRNIVENYLASVLLATRRPFSVNDHVVVDGQVSRRMTSSTDTIRSGVTASLVGLLLIVSFMLSYYKLSGVNAVVALVFQAIFTWATPFMDGVEVLVAGSGEWLAGVLPESWVRSLLIDGIWAGVGSVVVFLPQILILFLFLGILEDSGYMARAAVIADRLMVGVGLQGRAFLPLLLLCALVPGQAVEP